MKIKELEKIYDGNEQVVVLFGDVNCPIRKFTGRFCEIPEDVLSLEFWTVGAMGERRRTGWNLNKYGWTEIWLED